MQIVLDEARDSYAPEIVIELCSEGPQDIESNTNRIREWILSWVANNKDEASD